MAQQVLSVLEADTSCAEASVKPMLQVVDTNLGEPGLIVGADPGPVEHTREPPALLREDASGMVSTLPAHHRQSYAVEDNHSLITILHRLRRNDGNSRAQFWHINFPLPAQVADLTISAAGVHREERHI